MVSEADKPAAVRWAASGPDKKARKNQVRYLDGKVVTNKGQRFIVEQTKPEDPSTFVSIRIKTKGKRGPGYRG